MLTIKVWCLPELSQEKLEELFWSFVTEINLIKAMEKAGHTGTGKMLVLYPTDKMIMGLGSEVFVEVDGLSDENICNLAVRNELAEKLGKAVERLLPDAQVDCRVHRPDRLQGRWEGPRKNMPVEEKPTQ